MVIIFEGKDILTSDVNPVNEAFEKFTMLDGNVRCVINVQPENAYAPIPDTV